MLGTKDQRAKERERCTHILSLCFSSCPPPNEPTLIHAIKETERLSLHLPCFLTESTLIQTIKGRETHKGSLSIFPCSPNETTLVQANEERERERDRHTHSLPLSLSPCSLHESTLVKQSKRCTHRVSLSLSLVPPPPRSRNEPTRIRAMSFLRAEG